MTQIRGAVSWELPALNDEALFADWLAITPPESPEVVFEALDTLVTPPVIERQRQMQDKVNESLAEARSGAIAPQEASDQAKTAIGGLMTE